MNARIRPLPPEILACVKAAGKSYTHVLIEEPTGQEAELWPGYEREIAAEQDRERDEYLGWR